MSRPLHQPLHALGVIHGRFQVLHRDHLRYLLAGKERCDHLVVAITNPDPSLTKAEAADPERSNPLANPLTYYERQALVRAALREAGVAWEDFTIVPLPINFPELYIHYVPRDAVYFLTIYDQWGRAKKKRFEGLGLDVEVLWERPESEKGLTGHEVRQAMIQGLDWRSMTTPAVAELLEQWDIPARLREMVRG